MLKPKRKATPTGLGHVLLVEDDAILSLSIEAALLDAGAKSVDAVSSTSEALKALRAKQPDAVVIDVHLADSDDGWEIAELINAEGPNSARIVFSTGSPQDIPTKIAQMGAVLVKPYDLQDLVTCLKEPKHKGIFSRLRRN